MAQVVGSTPNRRPTRPPRLWRPANGPLRRRLSPCRSMAPRRVGLPAVTRGELPGWLLLRTCAARRLPTPGPGHEPWTGPPNLGMGGAGDDGSAGNRPQSNAAPRGLGSRLGAAACAAGNKRNAPPVLQSPGRCVDPGGTRPLIHPWPKVNDSAGVVPQLPTEPYGPGSTRTASPSSSLLSRADATQAADHGRSRMRLTRLKPARSTVRGPFPPGLPSPGAYATETRR
jgi:hypothetical protein